MLKLVTNNKTYAYDPLLPDAYLLRVAAISTKCGVFSAEDIFSAQNALLVKQGVLITPEIAEILRVHRLKKPIEQSIYLEREFSASDLEQALIQVLQQDDLLTLI